MAEITHSIQELVQAAIRQQQEQEIDPTIPKIFIPTRVSRASFVYERMRNAVDYKEEHLVRRNAVERTIRRMIASGKHTDIAEPMIQELIHARYLPNNEIPQEKISQINSIFEKYFSLIGLGQLKDINDSESLAGWMLGIMATEVDETLVPPHVMHASINAMYESMQKRLHIEDAIDESTRQTQVYLAASRVLYKNDDDTLRYHLLQVYYPHWHTADENLIREIGSNIQELRARMTHDLEHPLREKLLAQLRKHIAYFAILRDIILDDPRTAWSDMNIGEPFAARVRTKCTSSYAKVRATLYRSIRRSIVYLIVTKFLVALLLEVPIEYFVLNELHVLPPLINLGFPPALLAVIGLTSKLPNNKNTEEIVKGIENILHGEGDIIQMQKTRGRSIVLQFIFVVLYATLFLISFGLLVSVLQALDFTIVSILVFLFFLSLVSLFAYRIRLVSKELVVLEPKTGIIRGLWNFLTIPILHAGKWMSTKFARVNVFIFLLDFVIEAPFKSFVKIIEEWTSYVHEKKDEI